MNRLQNKLKELKLQNKKALVAFLTAGYPNLKTTYELIKVLEENGVDIIELGVPFSDPIADGPVIQESSHKALLKGINLESILNLVKRIREKTQIPILLMSYLNPIFHLGLEKVFKKAKNAGVDGFIIPDLIPEESQNIMPLCHKNNISLVFLCAPNTPDSRLKFIGNKTDSFVYIVSITGVTGKRSEFSSTLKEFLLHTKKAINKPRFLGFGISGSKQIKEIKEYVDGVIVGSALIEIIRDNKSQLKKKIALFVRSLRKALNY